MKGRYFGAGVAFLVLSSLVSATALDDYVAMPDASYSWTQVGSGTYDSATFTTAFTLRLNSQQWRNSSEVEPSQVLWRHWVTVIVPSSVLGPTRSTALLLINGGSTNDPAPAADSQMRLLSMATRSLIVTLTAVPNQPIRFLDESFSRSEDEIIAYTWDKFLNGGDSFWPAQLPMVKSVKACMDAVQAFAASQGKTVNGFVLTGGSKRGWTAWLTAAVDSRVIAAAPIVIDLLNMERSFAHHWACYGFWAPSLAPYQQKMIFDRFDLPRTAELLEIVDPYRYRSRLTLPKYIITASGDDFFVSDSAQFYIRQLSGETLLRTVPNSNHYLDGVYSSVFAGLVPFYDAVLNGAARPNYSWTVQPDGRTIVQTSTTPTAVKLWQITNPTARDFRRLTTGPNWTSTPLTDQGGGVYIGQVPVPPQGWTAYFVELTFPGRTVGGIQYPYLFTTEMVVVPEIRPFETDFSRDRTTDLLDLVIFSEHWLTSNPYRDLYPRRGGDGLVNLNDLALFGLHWLESF
ncbi:MAG: PhoPQ-activated protein PqaA family protein [Anaerohalosphaeraceae bacterium]